MEEKNEDIIGLISAVSGVLCNIKRKPPKRGLDKKIVLSFLHDEKVSENKVRDLLRILAEREFINRTTRNVFGNEEADWHSAQRMLAKHLVDFYLQNIYAGDVGAGIRNGWSQEVIEYIYREYRVVSVA